MLLYCSCFSYFECFSILLDVTRTVYSTAVVLYAVRTILTNDKTAPWTKRETQKRETRNAEMQKRIISILLLLAALAALWWQLITTALEGFHRQNQQITQQREDVMATHGFHTFLILLHWMPVFMSQVVSNYSKIEGPVKSDQLTVMISITSGICY